MPEILCRHFNGYKPCGLSLQCNQSCKHRSIPSSRVLIIHLGAMGAVLRSTALLESIHKKFENCHVTWVTQAPSDQLLKNNVLIDRILTTKPDDQLALSCLEFDAAFVIDKSMAAAGILKLTKYKKLFGFKVQSMTGAIVPATDAANELWEIGLSDHKKFFENKKPETQLSTEALELEYMRSEYLVTLADEELKKIQDRKALWSPRGEILVGLNTGCSPIIPYKKLTVEMHKTLVRELNKIGIRVVLLGGPEDTARNNEIANALDVIQSPTEQGLRDGFISVAACDIVVTGDSLGMHMAIAMKKYVVAWFGPTCAHEIDLFDRGEKILSKAGCSPCWKRSCHKQPMCYDLVEISDLMNGIRKGIQWLTSYSTQHSSEISSSQSHSLSSSAKLIPNDVSF